MQLKTSFCNGTIFRKNLTRFAPVWGVYTLCLLLGIFLMYSNGGTAKYFHFARKAVTSPAVRITTTVLSSLITKSTAGKR